MVSHDGNVRSLRTGDGRSRREAAIPQVAPDASTVIDGPQYLPVSWGGKLTRSPGKASYQQPCAGAYFDDPGPECPGRRNEEVATRSSRPSRVWIRGAPNCRFCRW